LAVITHPSANRQLIRKTPLSRGFSCKKGKSGHRGGPWRRHIRDTGNIGGAGTEDDDDHLYGYDAEYGMGGDATLGGMARHVAVAPRDVSTSLQYLDFEV